MLSWACALATKPASAQAKVAPRANLCIRIAFPSCSILRRASSAAWFGPRLRADPAGPAETAAEYAPSVGVGPHSELLFGELPQPRQSVWLNDQKEDDEGAHDHELQMFNGGRVDGDAEGLRSSAQEHR